MDSKHDINGTGLQQFKEYGANENKDEYKEIKSILFCVGRCREGSDIKYIDCGVYLDYVKKRSTLVAMQTSGRIMRKDNYDKKTHAIIIDTFIPDKKNEPTIMTARSIINYYEKILQLSKSSSQDVYHKFKDLINKTKIDPINKQIVIQIDDDDKHNCTIKLNQQDID